jgi:uncharacterized glyoxalase superfamily protein PhnB
VALDNDTALQAHSIIPSLTADDLQASIGFDEGLGFGVEQRWEEQGVLQGVMLIAGNTRIGLTQDDWKKGRDRVKGQGTRLFIGTNQDLDALAARAKAAGIALDSEPHDTPWGTRSFDLTDPTGFKITVEQE